MKILFYTDTEAFGGAERFLEDIIGHLAGGLHEICLVCANPQVFDRISSLNGFTISGCRVKNVFDLKGFFKLLKLFKEHKPDVVHFNLISPYSCQYAALVARITLPRKKIFCTVHMSAVPGSRYPFIGSVRRYIARRTLRAAEKCICPSKSASVFLINNYALDPNRVTTIYNGVLSVISGQSQDQNIKRLYNLFDKKLVVCVSRLVRDKGLETLVISFKKIARIVQHALLLIIGEGYLLKDLKTLVDKSDLTDKVLFLGFQANINKYLQIADVAVTPSFNENLPYSVLEAMAYGKAIVATSVGGIPELINEECGVLVPPNDSELLSAGLIKVLTEKDYAEQLAKKAKTRAVQFFSKERMCKEYSRILAGAE